MSRQYRIVNTGKDPLMYSTLGGRCVIQTRRNSYGWWRDVEIDEHKLSCIRNTDEGRGSHYDALECYVKYFLAEEQPTKVVPREVRRFNRYGEVIRYNGNE